MSRTPQERKRAGSGRAAFQYSGFRLYMAVRFLSAAASEMLAVAVGWQVYAMTNRPMDLGLVGLAQFLPGMLLFPLVGHTADRVRRQRIVQVCSAAFAVCCLLMLGFTLARLRSVLPIYLTMVGVGAVRAFNLPTGQAFLPSLVAEEHFPNAVAWGASVFQVAAILGPAFGGVLYAWTGSPAPVYACTATCYAVAFVLLLIIRPHAEPPPREAPSLKTMLEGFRYVWRKKVILGALSLDLFAVLLGGAVALLPIFARDVLHSGAGSLGALRSAPAVGAVIMAVIVAHLPLRRNAGVIMLWCVAGFGVFTIVFGMSHSFLLSLIALGLTGAFDMVSVIIRQTLVQIATPDAMRGRVSAVHGIFVGASNELGQFESGLTAQWFGAVPAAILGGVGTVLVVAAGAWIFPEVRKAESLDSQLATD